MRTVAYFLAGITFLCSSVTAQAPAPSHAPPPLTLTISTDRRTFAPGEGILIHAQLKNVSTMDVLIGSSLWSIGSPSRLTVNIRDLSGRPLNGSLWAADGFPADVSLTDLPRKGMQWALLLPPGYSYGHDTSADAFVQKSDLIAGNYAISADYVTDGIDANDDMNPFLKHPDVIATFNSDNWKGQISSNELTIRITSPRKAVQKTVRPH